MHQGDRGTVEEHLDLYLQQIGPFLHDKRNRRPTDRTTNVVPRNSSQPAAVTRARDDHSVNAVEIH